MPTENNTGAITGLLAYEYLNLGTFEAPQWVRIKRTEDVDLPDERNTGELKLKGSDFVKTLVSQRVKSVAFKYKPKRSDDPIFNELNAAYENAGSCVHYAATDRPITEAGAKGWSAPFTVTKFGESRPLENSLASMRPRSFERGRHCGCSGRLCIGQASMRPRSFERGRDITDASTLPFARLQ